MSRAEMECMTGLSLLMGFLIVALVFLAVRAIRDSLALERIRRQEHKRQTGQDK